MKKTFYVSKIRQANGDHEVHEASCPKLPLSQNRVHLGEYYTCAEAVNAARKLFPTADGCKICSPQCNTR
ncbi:hypothetical protein [Chitinophaga sp. sic0106]|uniref:hypothetical protein n=1 Tax=Chitinophaga sp. sic0106 TaxID=2854785 RepID=UPI001C451353|nr:hypothetical protein [Chitinophaga sp. sic0106]MBV7532849.1 hypothetical protein [Chitinophaga sp. sic0106]